LNLRQFQWMTYFIKDRHDIQVGFKVKIHYSFSLKESSISLFREIRVQMGKNLPFPIFII